MRALRGEGPTAFRYRDYGNMATIGRGSAVADIRTLKLSGFIAWLIWIFIHIFWLIGFRNRIAVMSEWAWFYVTMQRRVRLITGGLTWPQ
jgi:NADH dehydrogenase